jgi:hypothetical protein
MADRDCSRSGCGPFCLFLNRWQRKDCPIDPTPPSNDKKHSGGDRPTPLIDRVIRAAVSAFVDTNANQHHGQQPKNHPFREPITWATIVLALATAASVGVAALQWQTLDKTDETLKANERAFVFVTQFQAFIVKDTQRIFHFGKIADRPPRLTLQCGRVGKSFRNNPLSRTPIQT